MDPSEVETRMIEKKADVVDGPHRTSALVAFYMGRAAAAKIKTKRGESRHPYVAVVDGEQIQGKRFATRADAIAFAGRVIAQKERHSTA
jgi:hypothetical protein